MGRRRRVSAPPLPGAHLDPWGTNVTCRIASEAHAMQANAIDLQIPALSAHGIVQVAFRRIPRQLHPPTPGSMVIPLHGNRGASTLRHRFAHDGSA